MSHRKPRNLPQAELESSFELDLAPMLALMVTLIPIMLLSTVFVKIKVIDTNLPQVVQQALQEDRKKQDREVLVRLNLNANKALKLIVTDNGKVRYSGVFPATAQGWDLEKLHKELVKVKQSYPRNFRLDLLPDQKVPYEDIVKVMDEARTTKNGDPKLFILDKETQQRVETDVMFPDIIFANVVEG